MQSQTELTDALLSDWGAMEGRLKNFSAPPTAWEPPPVPAPTHRRRTPSAEVAVQPIAAPVPAAVVPSPLPVLASPVLDPAHGALPAWPDARGQASANASVPAISSPAAPGDSHALAEVLARTLRTQLDKSSGGRPIAVALAEGALSIADPDRPFDGTQYSGLNVEERQIVTKFQAACAALGRDLIAGKPTAEIARAIGSLVATLEPEPMLTVSRAEFATKVDGFGRLSVIDQRRFLPGRSTQVIVYSEIQGFSSTRAGERGTSTANGTGWVTTLATKVSILAKHDGTEVWTRDWQAVSDVSEVRRNDFFICEKITLSELLTVGTYLMKTTVRDDVSGAVAEKSIEFSIVADPALAGR